jgi:hypothetical protein
MSRFLIAVPKGRAFCGSAMLVGSDGEVRLGPMRVLATASARVAKVHDNPDVSPLLPYGHPPEGEYVVAASLPPGYVHPKRTRRYGRVGALLLAPKSGEALRAVQSGRKLIAIHGGPPDTKRRLRPTRGGVRLTNTGMRSLLTAMNDANLAGDPLDTIEIVEVDMELADEASQKGTHALPPSARRRASPKTAPTTTLPMVLLPLALGGGGKRGVERREVLISVAVAFGALAAEACNHASKCTPLACYSDDGGGRTLAFDGGRTRYEPDAGCPPRGYVCEYYGGGVG